MKDFFEHAKSNWVRYSEYELKEKDGILYIKPTDDAMPDIYNILKKKDEIVVEALNIGLLCMSKDKEKETEQKKAIMGFISRYGLLGLMTTITTTPSFMDYEIVHFIKNRFIQSETMDTIEYIKHFYPFKMLDVVKNGIAMRWDVSGDNTMMALAMTFTDRETAVNMSFQRNYSEPYEWVKLQFVDWALLFTTAQFYYEKEFEPEDRDLYRQMMMAFSTNAPSYYIQLADKPTLVWNFGSLAIATQMLLSLSITDNKTPIRLCKHCAKAFIPPRSNALFCSSKCKNQYNVYKSRQKNDQNFLNKKIIE